LQLQMPAVCVGQTRLPGPHTEFTTAGGQAMGPSLMIPPSGVGGGAGSVLPAPAAPVSDVFGQAVRDTAHRAMATRGQSFIELSVRMKFTSWRVEAEAIGAVHGDGSERRARRAGAEALM
jgi:hypothetical protein